MDAVKTKDLFDLTHSLAGEWLSRFCYPWEALDFFADMITEMGKHLPEEAFVQIKENVWAAKSAKIAETASITGPCIIDEGAEVRHAAFIRGSALIGKDCVVGNSTELKNVLLFDGVQVPHYNYVGDSVLGFCAHMGAGAITSNVKSDKTPVVVHAEQEYETGRKKFGAVLGDFAEVGCNSVLNPGTVIGKGSRIYPLSSVRGVIKEGCIYKSAGEICEIQDSK